MHAVIWCNRCDVWVSERLSASLLTRETVVSRTSMGYSVNTIMTVVQFVVKL